MEKYSYVYILLDKNRKKFKIGLTKDILQRYKTLKSLYGDFSIEDSYLIKCENDYGLKLEKILHFVFSNFKIDIDSSYDGYTEWFDVSSLDKVLDFIEIIKGLNKNIIEIKKNIQEIEALDKRLSRCKVSKNKKEYRIRQLKKENVLKTLYFLRTIKKLIISNRLYKENDFTLIVEKTTYTEAEEIGNKLFLLLFFETTKMSGGLNFTSCVSFTDNKLYIKFNFNTLNKYKNIDVIKRSYVLLRIFFKKYLDIDITNVKL